MLKDVGLVVNCGRWRLMEKPACSTVTVNFVSAVEVFDSELSESIDELRSLLHEVVASWSHSKWYELKKQERRKVKVK